MPAAQRTIVINRPVDEVFAFFADPANEQRWRTHVKEVAASEPIAVGTHVHQTVKGPGGRGIPADFEVTGYESGSRYAFRVVAGPVRPVGEFRFAPDGSAATVSLSLSADLAGWKKLLLSRSVQSAMNSEMQALDRARALLESS
jgi:uncharacterized membrane protein